MLLVCCSLSRCRCLSAQCCSQHGGTPEHGRVGPPRSPQLHSHDTKGQHGGRVPVAPGSAVLLPTPTAGSRERGQGRQRRRRGRGAGICFIMFVFCSFPQLGAPRMGFRRERSVGQGPAVVAELMSSPGAPFGPSCGDAPCPPPPPLHSPAPQREIWGKEWEKLFNHEEANFHLFFSLSPRNCGDPQRDRGGEIAPLRTARPGRLRTAQRRRGRSVLSRFVAALGPRLSVRSCAVSLPTESPTERSSKKKGKRFDLIQKIIKISCIFISLSIQQSENIETPSPLALKSHNCSILLVLTV